MAQYIYPPQHHELLSGLPWISSLARREYNVIAPLGTWLRDGNHGYYDIPPGLRNEVFFKDLNTGEIHASALWRDWGWGEEDMQELVGQINDSRAKILLIALGSPHQEKWFATYKDSLKYVRVVQAVGGTLDTIAGTVKRAPQNWQRCSAEWLYRLIAQPSRIKRQKVLPLFAAAVLAAKLRQLLLGRG